MLPRTINVRGKNEEGICELTTQESGKVSYAIQNFGNEVIHGILLLRLKKTICSKKRQLRDSPGFSIISSLILNKAVHVAGSQFSIYNQKWAKALVMV